MLKKNEFVSNSAAMLEELGMARKWMSVYARQARHTQRGRYRKMKIMMALNCRVRREYLKNALTTSCGVSVGNRGHQMYLPN